MAIMLTPKDVDSTAFQALQKRVDTPMVTILLPNGSANITGLDFAYWYRFQTS
jgi:hypothetical protein